MRSCKALIQEKTDTPSPFFSFYEKAYLQFHCALRKRVKSSTRLIGYGVDIFIPLCTCVCKPIDGDRNRCFFSSICISVLNLHIEKTVNADTDGSLHMKNLNPNRHHHHPNHRRRCRRSSCPHLLEYPPEYPPEHCRFYPLVSDHHRRHHR